MTRLSSYFGALSTHEFQPEHLDDQGRWSSRRSKHEVDKKWRKEDSSQRRKMVFTPLAWPPFLSSADSWSWLVMLFLCSMFLVISTLYDGKLKLFARLKYWATNCKPTIFEFYALAISIQLRLEIEILILLLCDRILKLQLPKGRAHCQRRVASSGFYQYVLRAVRYSYVLVQAVQYQPQGSTR